MKIHHILSDLGYQNIVPIQIGTRLVTYTTSYLLKNAENTHELKVEKVMRWMLQ